MPQGPIPTYVTNAGGTNSALNVTAAKVVKSTPGKVARVVVIAPGSGSGSLVINDNNALGGSNTAANTVLSIAFGSLTVGQVIPLDFPCLTGITVSAVPAGSPIFAISYS